MNTKLTNKLTKTQVSRFMASRHPAMKFYRSSDSWVDAGSGYGLSAKEAREEALAEVELWEDGLASKPSWLDA